MLVESLSQWHFSSPLQAVTKAKAVYVETRSRILKGTLAPGSAVNQEALAADLGVSITPLREALRLQLGVLVGDPGYEALKLQVQRIAEDLLDPTVLNNPVVVRYVDLLTDLVGEDWWQNVALSMLETMRRTIRGLVRLIGACRVCLHLCGPSPRYP